MKAIITLLFALIPLMSFAQNTKELTPEQKLEQAQKQLEAAQKAVAEAKANAEKAKKEAEEAKAKAASQKKKQEEAKAKELAKKQAEIQKQIEEAQQEAARLNAEAARLKEEAKNAEDAANAVPEDGTPVTVSEGTNEAGWSKATTTKRPAPKVMKKSPTSVTNYLAGAVPMEDGRIVFTLDVDVPGKSAQQIYDITYNYINNLTQDENQKGDENAPSMIALVNKQKHQIAARMVEWLVFTSNFISLDRSEFDYTLIANCSDGHLNMTMERLYYSYEDDLQKGIKSPAENWISDKYSLNKSKTKLNHLFGKFRRATIDRKNEIFNNLRAELLQ